MRAGFLGQNICSLGFGIATLQAPRLVMDEPLKEAPAPVDESLRQQPGQRDEKIAEGGKGTLSTDSVANPQRLCV